MSNCDNYLGLSIILVLICAIASQECIRATTENAYIERERTFLMIKPDGVQRGLIGEIIKRFEQKGLKLVALKLQWVQPQFYFMITPQNISLQADQNTLKQHYQEHQGKNFFPFLMEYISSGPIVPMVWEGSNAVKVARLLLGSTNPSDSAPGTIRGDLALDAGRNLLHASDSVESANIEIALWFEEDELIRWGRNSDFWVHEG